MIAAQVDRFRAEGGAAGALQDVSGTLDAAVIVVLNSAQTEAVLFGPDGLVPQMREGSVVIACWMLENRAPHIVAGDYTPHSQVNIWPKDPVSVLDIAKSTGFEAPIAAAALERYLQAVQMGLGQEDDAAVAKVYARDAGLTLLGSA